MIVLDSVYAKNYKAYKEVVIDVSKFNVFIGKNSAGKSALVRLIPFVINSLNLDGDEVIDFSPLNIDIGAEYSDVVHGHAEFSQISLGANFKLNNIELAFVTELTYSTELKKTVVLNFYLATNDQVVFEVNLDLESLEKKKELLYLFGKERLNLKFNGLLPDFSSLPSIIKNDNKELFELVRVIKNHDFNLSYLGPTRSELSRTFTNKTMRSLNVGEKGQFAPYIFKYKDEQSNGVLGNKIKEWMLSRFNGKYFILKNYEKAFAIFCSSGLGESNIIDEGVGFGQIFPSVVNRFARDLDKVKGIELIEQPELHMHPAACGSIADLYLTAISSNMVFVETHSKEFILRLRRRIAEGIDEKDINIFYVDTDFNKKSAVIEKIIINKNGAVKNWPAGIFEEDFDEVMALQEANKKK
ncbi:DUF3696 domain-containing protein [Pantoea dispersa]|uniref:AAA family ATPase n=1 Tax=Pantoea dispersa TaxID=59814 RepID=UPI003528D060